MKQDTLNKNNDLLERVDDKLNKKENRNSD